MALFHSHFFSETLGMQTAAEVIIPQPAGERQIGVGTVEARDRWPCLWLLHGLSDDHTIWTRRSSIERYAEEAGVAVVMPNAHRSFYCDMENGGAYWTFLSEELPRLMRSFFPLSARRGDNAVAGLSMGGYGAAKWLLREPEAFVAGASLSGVMDIVARVAHARAHPEEVLRGETLRLVYGDLNPAGGPDDLYALAAEAAKRPDAPPLLQICGTEDFLYEDNLAFKRHAEQCGLNFTFREDPGDHGWGFWDAQIRETLAWLAEQGFGRSG